MADDRLDDAIAAVTRAVARIEAVTRGVAEPPLPDLPPVREPRTPPPPSFTDRPAAFGAERSGGFAARPATALGGSLVPEPQAAPDQESEPGVGDWAEHAPAESPTDAAQPAPEPLASYAPMDDDDAPTAQIHELVGRIIARTQTLEEHLDAARQLRFEITDLVSRLAAAAERDR